MSAEYLANAETQISNINSTVSKEQLIAQWQDVCIFLACVASNGSEEKEGPNGLMAQELKQRAEDAVPGYFIVFIIVFEKLNYEYLLFLFN